MSGDGVALRPMARKCHSACAPVLEPGATTRPVLVPPGHWQGSDGSVTSGPAEIVLEVDLESMPYWRKIN
jgi:alpha-glucosidase (family GH31 glycosyl hydrolase)